MSVRVKTEQRRQAIIDVALEIFREVGFERASMAVISRRLGGSKGTLYGYFRSKEKLFEAAMKYASEGPGDQIMDLLDPESDNLRAVLNRFAKAYLAFILGKQVLAITRTAIHEGYSSLLGPHLFAQGPGRALIKMTKFFTEVMKRGKLRKGSPSSASLHFKGLIEAGFLEEALYGAERQKEKAIAEAVDAFLRAYEP
jgi:AcrR family transcriptional regulator